MTNKVYEVAVNLDIPYLRQSNNLYCLDNIENIIKQLFVATHCKASIRNEAGRLYTSCAANGQMLFYLDITVPEHLINKFQCSYISGVVNLDEVVENQLKIQGKLKNTLLAVYYKDQNNPETIALPDVVVSLKKTKNLN